MIKTVCDRCGKDFFYLVPMPWEAWQVNIRYRGIRPDVTADLCRDCTKSLSNWLDEKKEVRRYE